METAIAIVTANVVFWGFFWAGYLACDVVATIRRGCRLMSK